LLCECEQRGSCEELGKSERNQLEIRNDNGEMNNFSNLLLRVFKKNDTFASAYKKCPNFQFLKTKLEYD